MFFSPPSVVIRQKIERSSLSGSNREVVVSTAIYPFALTMFGQFIYWSDWNTRSIYRANKHDGSDQRAMIQNLPSRPMDIHVLAGGKQQQCDSPCQQFNGGCSHICSPGESRWSSQLSQLGVCSFKRGLEIRICAL